MVSWYTVGAQEAVALFWYFYEVRLKSESYSLSQEPRQIEGKLFFLPLQRIARRDKEAFFSDQCKEIEEKNRMGKTRDLFKKVRDTKGIFHAKMGMIGDINDMNLPKAEDIKKRW